MNAAPLLPSLRPCSACAALSLGAASPNPQPPSLSCATTGPAHFPDVNPQHPAAQSASDVHGPVMNCLPAPLPAPLPLPLPLPAGAGAAVCAGGAAGGVASAFALPGALGTGAGAAPRRAWAALSLGWASPKPQPPSRSRATMGPAHWKVWLEWWY